MPREQINLEKPSQNPPQKQEQEIIDDEQKAQEMAYAEKRFRDSVYEQKSVLTEEEKEILERIAEMAGNKAGQKYDKDNSKEALVVLERLREMLSITPTDQKTEETEELRERASKRLTSYRDLKVIERIIPNSSFSPRKRYELSKEIVNSLRDGANKGFRNSELPKIDLSERALSTFDGYILGNLEMEKPEKVINKMENLAKLLGGDIKKIIKEFLPYIEEIKGEALWPDWQKAMEKLGFIWSLKGEKFIDINFI